LRARDYDPATAQFLTVDPEVDKTRQPYTYVAGNPLDNSDPTGLSCAGLLPGNSEPKSDPQGTIWWDGQWITPADVYNEKCSSSCPGVPIPNAAGTVSPIVCIGGGVSELVAGVDVSGCVVLFASGPVAIGNLGEFGIDGPLGGGASVPAVSGLVGAGFTNATNEKELLGPFKTTTVAAGIGLYVVGSQVSTSGTIWVEIVGWAPSTGVEASVTVGDSTTVPITPVSRNKPNMP
jgi:hypothetical protein